MNLEDSRRLVSVRISTSLIAMSLKQDAILAEVKVEQGLPVDAQLVNSYTEYATNNTVLTFMHSSFDVVPESYPVPFMNILFTRVLP